MTDPTASAAKAARLDAQMATEFAAYAHRHGLTVTGDLTATGAVLGGTLGPLHARKDLEALVRKWGGQFTATENEDGTLTVAGTLTVEAWVPPIAEDFAGDLSAWDQPVDTDAFTVADGHLIVTQGGGSGYLVKTAPAFDTPVLSLRLAVDLPADLTADAIDIPIGLIATANNATTLVALFYNHTSDLWVFGVFGRDEFNDSGQDEFPGATLRGAEQVVEYVYDRTAPVAVGRCYVNGALVATASEALDGASGTADPAIVPGAIAIPSAIYPARTYTSVTVSDAAQGLD